MAEGNDSYYQSRPEMGLELESDCLCDDILVNIPTSAFSRGCTLEERFEKLPIFEKPLCLIHTDSGGKLAINESVLSQINLIDVPLNVVAVCGLYRTGKSYLMNRLAGQRKGFSLGATTKSHTKGIWAWCKVHPTQDGQVLLLLDTEGLADIKKGDTNHDNHLSGLALLLSSTMIYNITGVFNQEALEKLTSTKQLVSDYIHYFNLTSLRFITQLSRDVQVMSDRGKSETNDSLIRAISPFFVLCLRDFFLDIEVEDEDKQLTPDEYFEQCLIHDSNDSHPESKSYNKTRECIKKYFPNRKCFTLSQPALKKKLKKIEELDDKELDEDFVSEMDQMRDFVYERQQKYLDSVTNIPVNGSVFATITSTYVETLRKGSPLTYQDAFAQVAQHHNSNLAEKVFREFSEEMDSQKLPFKRKVMLQDIYNYQQNKWIPKFREEAYPFRLQEFEVQIMDKMQNKWTELESKNSSEVRKICNDTLQILYLDIVDSRRPLYDTKLGFDKYKRQMGSLEKSYNSLMGDYDNDERMQVWQEFKSSKSDEKMSIYRAPTKRSDQARYDDFKKDVEEKLKKGFEEQMKKIVREREVNIEKQIKNMEALVASIMSENKMKSKKELPTPLPELKEDSKSCILM